MADELVVGPHPPGFRHFWLPIGRFLTGITLFVLGPVRVRGAYRVPAKGGMLVLANHIADIDPIVVQYACPRPIHFMAKSELFQMPVLGWIMRQFRAFGVRRGEPDRQALKHSAALLKAGELVGIFPEGQLSEDGELQELKAGVALIARMAGTPIICCGISGTQRIIPYGKVIPRPAWRTVNIVWGEARTFAKDASSEEVLAWIRGQLLSLVDSN